MGEARRKRTTLEGKLYASLMASYTKGVKALAKQADLLEAHSSSPHTSENSSDMARTAEAVHMLGNEVRAWKRETYS